MHFVFALKYTVGDSEPAPQMFVLHLSSTPEIIQLAVEADLVCLKFRRDIFYSHILPWNQFHRRLHRGVEG